MSISDKLTAIAENQQKVFDAGKLAVLRDSKYMNATVSGTVVALNDVSPTEHDVAVRLSSDTVTDFSEVQVKQQGKNLLDLSQYTFVTCVNNGDGTIQANFTDKFRCRMETSALNALLMVNRGKSFTFSIKADTTPSTRLTAVIYGTRTDGKTYKEVNGKIGNDHVTFTVDEAFTNITSLDLRMLEKAVSYTDKETIIRDIQLEFGSVATGYEPYIKPTSFVPSADGLVAGVKSLAPSTTLTVGTDGVVITCSYLRDVDTYIDSLTGGAV